METIFPREEKADLLFDKILKDPEACERLMQTFYGEIDSDLELVGGYLPPEQFAKALFDAYKNRDLTAFLMAVCKTACLTYCATHFWHRSALMRTDRSIRICSRTRMEI